jgi:hypothetical protein
MLKKDFPTHESTCELIPLTCEECKLVYRKNEATTKHTESICLREQLNRLRNESKDSKSEIQKLRSQLTAIQTLASKM